MCEEMSLELATINSEAEATFLISRYPVLLIGYNYWIGGRDVGTIEQFAWDNGSGPVLENPLANLITIRTCIMYYLSSQIQGNYLGYPCDEKHELICQTVFRIAQPEIYVTTQLVNCDNACPRRVYSTSVLSGEKLSETEAPDKKLVLHTGHSTQNFYLGQKSHFSPFTAR
jgi:hypothetical protein